VAEEVAFESVSSANPLQRGNKRGILLNSAIQQDQQGNFAPTSPPLTAPVGTQRDVRFNPPPENYRGARRLVRQLRAMNCLVHSNKKSRDNAIF
jgi:hypothetical protein